MTAKKVPLFVMLGGFLGAGKTTSLLRLAHYFQIKERKVGVITNDQAAGLVDTALAAELDLPVREIAGGCFCCRSESLVEALERLEQDRQPDVFIAEPVGSCTDLVATVSLPLERIYRKGFRMAPYSVLVDPFRALHALGAEPAAGFSPDVNYIYRKQLEEAEIIVINKMDVISSERLARLKAALAREYPDARILTVSSREGRGLGPWFSLLESETAQPRRVMEVDYARYGTGEALLGWYNAQLSLHAPAGRKIDGNEWLMSLAHAVHEDLKADGIEIAHFKMTLAPEGARTGLAAVNLVRTGTEPEAQRRLTARLEQGNLLVNLRAEAAPERLSAAVRQGLKKCPGATTTITREEAFRPGQPQPTHRVDSIR